VQPDVFVVGDMHKIDDRGVCGAPDWIAEVLSPATARYDRTRKLSAYERAGVPELWLVDPASRTVTIYRIASGRYAQPAVLPLSGRTVLMAVPGISIDWDRVLSVSSDARQDG
jgi:Uma2 family endonuclease